MAIIWLRSAIQHNKWRLWYLISLLPLIVIIAIFVYLYFTYGEINDKFWDTFITFNTFWLAILAIWIVIGVAFQKSIIFSFTGAREISRKESPKVYNIVENLCISRGLPTPKIWIIDDPSMNAFATWRNPKNSWIVFSKGILDTLNEKEIEAVAGHELTHIINGDIKNMVIINVFIWAIGTIGYILMRTRGKKNPLPLLGIILYLISVILLPLINLAISRKKEFLADAGSVELTHDKYAMISALQKISSDPVIENVEKQSSTIAAMFINNPKARTKISWFKKITSTHPPLEERIAALKMY